jgi:hypothetical protein
MKLNLKTVIITTISLLTSVAGINSSVWAGDVQVQTETLKLSNSLECNLFFIRKFTQMPVIKNSSGQTIAPGKVIYWQAYQAGKPSSSKQSIPLNIPLVPGQTIGPGGVLTGNSE